MSNKDFVNSPKIQELELETLKGLFPHFFSEGNFDIEGFKSYLEGQTTDNNEFYRFEWTGKKNAKQIASKPTKNTLIPDQANSKNWDTTENLFIEGDNLEVLKLLLNKYYGQIKMIYIDPPYNKDKDFVYKDTWKDNLEDYLAQTGQVDENGETTTEKETTGRKHSNWLNMIYPRLILARKLLKEDGVIFVSIDDDEVHNLRKVMDEVFGEDNFIGQFIWHKKVTGGYDNEHLNTQHEYVIFYSKNKSDFKIILEEKESKYKLEDENGKKFKWDSLWNIGGLTYSKSLDYPILSPEGTEIWPIGEKGVSFWLWSKDKVEKERNLLNFVKQKDGTWKVYKRVYASDGLIPGSILDKNIVKGNTFSSAEIKELFNGKKVFDYAKPSTLFTYLFARVLNKNDIILDFFAGSGTTAHAVMDLNKEDGGNRKFICVQLPEKVAKNSEAEKAGYKTISEITRARIDKAGEKIKSEEGGENVDIGFRAFKLAESNFKYMSEKYEINENTSIEQMELLMQKEVEETGLIEGRTEIDVIYELIIREGYSFYSKIEKLENGVYKISDENKYFYALIQEKLSEENVRDFVKNHLEEKQVRFFALEESLSESARATLVTYFTLHNI